MLSLAAKPLGLRGPCSGRMTLEERSDTLELANLGVRVERTGLEPLTSIEIHWI